MSGSHVANSVARLVLRLEPLGRLFIEVPVVFVRFLRTFRLDRELVVLHDDDLVLERASDSLAPVVPVDVHREGTDRSEDLVARVANHAPLVRNLQAELPRDGAVAVDHELLARDRNESEVHGAVVEVVIPRHPAQPLTEQHVVTLGEAAVVDLDRDGVFPLDLARDEIIVAEVDRVHRLAEARAELGVLEHEVELESRVVLAVAITRSRSRVCHSAHCVSDSPSSTGRCSRAKEKRYCTGHRREAIRRT